MARPTSPASVGRRTTTPVTPSSTASPAPPDPPGHLGDPRRRRLQEHDPEPLLLEAQPPVPAQHGEHVGRAHQAGQVLVGHPAEQPDRGPGLRHPAGEAFGVPAPAGDGDGEVRDAGRQAGGGVDEDVHPLAGHQAAHAHHQGPVGGEAEVGAGPGPIGGGQRA